MRGYQKDASVYAVRCKATGRVYIGSSIDVMGRIKAHFTDLRAGRKAGTSPDWQRDYDTYGEDAFDFYLMETGVDVNLRRLREAYWIAEYNATDPRFGYNRDKMPTAKKVELVNGLPPKKQEGTHEQDR